MKPERAVVLLSGGIDSAVCLWLAKEKKWEIHSISFNYHNRQKKEIEASQKLAARAAVKEHRVIDLPFLREFNDHEIKPSNLSGQIPSAYIPSRNLVFYSIAASWAESLSARYVVGGHNNNDFGSFPDSRPEFYSKLNRLVGIGSLATVELTWSCYERDDVACGICIACKIRLKAFSNLGLKDSIPYAEAFYDRSSYHHMLN
ncbi:MAG: 7-cyano-7-deazaguanine synthase [Thaumarchaeota archaeon]|nr:7-cyano-7-deazaguanine synthase [Nitrososphaerota archaeon]